MSVQPPTSTSLRAWSTRCTCAGLAALVSARLSLLRRAAARGCWTCNRRAGTRCNDGSHGDPPDRLSRCDWGFPGWSLAGADVVWPAQSGLGR